MVRVTCDAWYDDVGTRDRVPTVLDFACGSGTFLVQALEYLARTVEKVRGLPRSQALREVVTNLYGVDLSSIAVYDAVANLLHTSMLPLEEVNLIAENLVVGNSLIEKGDPQLDLRLGANWEAFKPVAWREFARKPSDKGKFDIILANPPFKSIEQMRGATERAYYEGRYDVAHGRWDQAFLFVELALRLVSDDGVIGLVLPASVLKSDAGRATRRLVEERGALFQIVDFTDKSVFPGVSTYTAVVFLKANRAPSVKQMELHEFPREETARSWFFHHLLNQEAPPGFSVSITEGDPPRSDGAPWVMTNRRERQLTEAMETVAEAFPCHITVEQGVKTGLNQAFLVEEVAREASGYVAVRTHRGLRTLENRFLRIAVLGEDISRYSLRQDTRRVVFPYDEDGTIVPEDLLSEEAPFVWQYLNEWKTELSNRRSLRRAAGPWYSFIWPRGTWVQRPKLLGPDYAQQSSFAYDETGEVVPIGGNAIVSADVDMRTTLALLNSSLVNWHITKSSVRRRGSYFAFYGRFIEGLPLIDVSKMPGADEVQRIITEQVERISHLHRELRRAAGSDPRQSVVASELATIDREIDDLVLHLYDAYEYQDLIWGS